MASITTWSLLVIAILVGVGGIMGYVKAKSKASIASGITSAALYTAAFMFSQQEPHQGFIAGAVISAILCVVFAIRLKKTGKFMPAGMMLLCCGIELVLCAAAAFT